MSRVLSVGLVAACDDPELLGFRLWPRQREILRAVEEDARLHVLALGRRSGKSTMLALIGLWDACLRPGLRGHVRPGERRHVVAVATNIGQARLVIQAARSIVMGSPLLSPLLEGESEDELHFSTGCTFSAFPCTSRGGRGWPISTLLLDELAHFTDSEGSNVAAETVVRALMPATAQFGADARVVASSTPWGSDGVFAEMFAQAVSGELEGAVAHQATTAEANPLIDAGFLAAEERRDPEGFKSEFLAQFVGSGLAFFDPVNVAAAVSLPGELRPGDASGWVAGLDPAFSSDPFALVLVGQVPGDRGRLLVGRVQSWLPPRRKAVSLEEGRELEDAVLAEVAVVVREFGARAVTDQYRSAGVTDRLRRFGIRVRSVGMTAPTKDAAFGFLRGRVNEGTIELPGHPGLLRELRAVRTRYAANRSSVVLPRIGGSHCDLAQALAIAVFELDGGGRLGRRAGAAYSPVDVRLPVSSAHGLVDFADRFGGLGRGCVVSDERTGEERVMAKGLPRNLQRVSRDKMDGLIREREDAFREARKRVQTAGRTHAPAEADRVRADAMAAATRTTEELKALRAELARRVEAAPDGQRMLRMAAQAAGVDSRHELDEHERARDEARKQQLAERERELAVRRAADERAKYEDLVAAGRIYVPVGGWDADAADALAAVMSSEYVWRCLERHGDMPVLDAQHLAFLHLVLGVLAENGGTEVTLDLNRPFPHLPHDISRNRRVMLDHLAANGFIALSGTKGSKVTIRRGSRTEELRESFQKQRRQRAKPPSVSEEVTGWLADVKAWASGLGKDVPTTPEPAKVPSSAGLTVEAGG